MQYVKNKIVARSAGLEPVSWNQQKKLDKSLIELEGEFTFDLFFDVDRDKWFKLFDQNKKRIESNDYIYIAKQLALKKEIQKIERPDTDFVFSYIPKDQAESHRDFLYNELILNQKLLNRYILPELRKSHSFSPLASYIDNKFFSFDMTSFDIEVFKVPHYYTMREIFKVKFKMLFNLQDYFEHMLITKGAKFKIDMWPELTFRIEATVGFPFVFINDKVNFYRAIENNISQYLKRNSKILSYIYRKTKIRLDKVGGFSLYIDRLSNSMVVRPANYFEFTNQMIAGKIDIFNKRSPYPGLTVQSVNYDFVKTNANPANTASLPLLYFFIFAYLNNVYNRKKPSKSEVVKIYNNIKSGKLKMQDMM